MSAKKAFELIKEYFLHPPILVPPQHGKPLLLYLSIIGDAIGSMLAQEDNEKNERGGIYSSGGVVYCRRQPKIKPILLKIYVVVRVRIVPTKSI